MLHLTAHHDLGDAIALADIDQFAELAEGDPVTAVGEGLYVFRCFFLDGDDGDLIASWRALSSASRGKRPLPAMSP